MNPHLSKLGALVVASGLLVAPLCTTAADAAVAPVVQAAAPAEPVLHIGAHGPAVVKVQQILGLRADGRYTAQVSHAVKVFQVHSHLPATGVVEARTWKALDAKAAAAARARLAAAKGALLLLVGRDAHAVNHGQLALASADLPAHQRHVYSALLAEDADELTFLVDSIRTARSVAEVMALKSFWSAGHQSVTDACDAVALATDYSGGFVDTGDADFQQMMTMIGTQLDALEHGGHDVTAARAAMARVDGDLAAWNAVALPAFTTLAAMDFSYHPAVARALPAAQQVAEASAESQQVSADFGALDTAFGASGVAVGQARTMGRPGPRLAARLRPWFSRH